LLPTYRLPSSSRLRLLFGLALLSLACGTAGWALAADEGGTPPYLQQLGRKLFFDASLSADGKVSCASCHRPDHEFADPRSVSQGVFGRTGTRNAPSLLARQPEEPLMWDGRRGTLESQVLDPLTNSFEHGLSDFTELSRRLAANPAYLPLFRESFAVTDMAQVQPGQVANSLAAFVGALPREPTPVERYLAGNVSALDDHEKRGMVIFRERARCADCHLMRSQAAAVSDGTYHSVGIGLDPQANLAQIARRGFAQVSLRGLDSVVLSDAEVAALGRFLVTSDPRDIGKFRTPGLRRVSRTAPYMHDGSVATLEEALDRELYYRSLALGSPISLTPDEREDLLRFLRAL
jgi:cytochrome c peroxidase